MTDTDLNRTPLAEEDNGSMSKREYDEDEPESLFYVEKRTRFIYEVKLFPEFALIRPAHPDFSANVERIPLTDFAVGFDEYWGDSQAIRNFLWGDDHDGMEIEKK